MLSLTLLAAFALPRLQDATLEERLWEASKRGEVAAIEALIGAGADVDARTEFDATALYFAASNDHAEACAALAKAGAALDVADNFYSNTPIGMAGWLGYADCVRVLIEAGSQGGIGAMFAAAGNGHAGVVAAVLESLEVPPAVRDSACQQAADAGYPAVVEVFLAHGASEPTPPAADAGAAAADPLRPKVDDPYVPVIEPQPWPGFRGPRGNGVADGQHPPLTWSVESGEHVRWRTAVEGLGHSSPVVWGNKVFLTTAVGAQGHTGTFQGDRGWIGSAREDYAHRFEVRCYRLSDGALLWSTLCHEGEPRADRHWKASHASSTVAVDADHVVASFGSEGLYCLDHEGEVRWQSDLGLLDAGWFVDDSFGWGYGSSPVIWEDRVIVQCDVKAPDFAAALALSDGAELWRAERDELPSWGTPAICAGPDGDEVVMNASNAIRSYDPLTGDVLWELRGNSKITVASPVSEGGLICVTGGYQRPAPIYVVRAGALGDLTPEAGQDPSDGLVWSTQRGGVYQPTPLLYGGLLYLLKNNGILSCYDAGSGEQLYQQRVAGAGIGQYTASMVAADGFLYLTDEEGLVHVCRAGEEFELAAINDLGGRTLATPAISNGVLLFRTQEELIAVAQR